MKKQDIKASTLVGRAELGARIGEVADMLGTRVKAARVAGISTDQLARYILGAGEVSFMPIARMADGAGVNLDWVAIGVEPKLRGALRAAEPAANYRRTKAELLGFVTGGVDDALQGGHSDKRALFISLTYDYMNARGSRDPVELAAFIGDLIMLAATQPPVPDFHSPEVAGPNTKK